MDQVPAKLSNNGSIPTVDEVEVLMNAFRMDLSKAKAVVYKFELKFIKTSQRRDQDGELREVDIDLSKGQGNDFARQAKRRMLWECYQKLLNDNTNFFTGDSRQHSYDCGINFYSLLKLLNRPGDTQSFRIALEALSPESRTYLGLRRTVAVRAELKVPGQFEQQELELRDAHFNVEDHSLEQFIDVLTTTEMHVQDSHLHYPQSKYFLKDAEIQLRDEARVLKPGLAKNVRFVGNNPADSRLIVQIEPRKTAFFPAVSVIDFLSALLPGGGPTMGLVERLTLGNAFEVASQQLKGLVVLTTHRNDSFPIHGLTQQSARDLKFRQRDGSETTVAMYFAHHYNGLTILTHPRLPCAIQRKPQQDGSVQESYHPLELLRIAPGQRVPIEKQTPALVEKMLNECQIAPEAYMERAMEAREAAFITPMANNRSFQVFEVDINQNPAKVKAQLLYPPAVEFSADGRDREEVRDGLLKWGKVGDGQRRFLIPAQGPVWAAILFGGLSPNEAGAFLELFIHEANRRGIVLGPARYQDSINSTGINELRQGFKETYKANGVRYVLFFTKDKLDPVHDTMKELEREHSIVTQHVWATTVTRALDKSRGGQMIIDNIMLKFNLKLGGVNYGLATSGEFRQRIGGIGGRDVVKEGWLDPGRMFFGIDLSHASAQSRFQRQKEEPVSEPTVVGCAYTLGHPLLMRGSYWYQEPRLTYVGRPPLAGRIEVALASYHAKAKRFPHHVFVYRAGVSEGEFAAVLEHERNAFIDAFDSLRSKHGSAFVRPRLTIIVVQEHSSYRMVPTAPVAKKWREQEEKAAASAKKPSPSGSPVKAFNANVRPGTCVDGRIMHPTLTEFLLVGHRAIKGTARPIRCSVVWDDPGAVGGAGARVSLEELENVTNALCYAHGIVCSPVSLPAPLYAASELAKRGRNNWKVRRGEDDERLERGDVNVAGIFHLQREQMDQPANFFGRMSAEMEARIPTKFWA